MNSFQLHWKLQNRLLKQQSKGLRKYFRCLETVGEQSNYESRWLQFPMFFVGAIVCCQVAPLQGSEGGGFKSSLAQHVANLMWVGLGETLNT